jgi:hypothetical protein
MEETMSDHSPKDTSELQHDDRRSRSMRALRIIACVLLACPFVVVWPIRYWVYRVAGGWFVSTNIDFDQRQMFLTLMFILLMASITVFSYFGASVLLWSSRWRPALSKAFTIVFGLLLLPASWFLSVLMRFYLYQQ